MQSEPLVSFSGVSRLYGARLIFRRLNLELLPGRIYLLLGPNGAGKSTLLRLAAGLAKPDSGTVRLLPGTRLSFLGHATWLYPALTAFENLRFWARAHGLKTAAPALLDFLAHVGLERFAHEKVRVFSRGMAQRLSFARCLLPEPDLLLLDEPFSGMDSETQEILRAELSRRRDHGAAILLVSHSPETDRKFADMVLRIADHSLIKEEVSPQC